MEEEQKKQLERQMEEACLKLEMEMEHAAHEHQAMLLRQGIYLVQDVKLHIYDLIDECCTVRLKSPNNARSLRSTQVEVAKWALLVSRTKMSLIWSHG